MFGNGWFDRVQPQARVARLQQEIVARRTEKWLYLYDGWDIIGVMDAGGQLVETYTRGVGLAGDPARWAGLVAVTHYVRWLGSGGTPATYYLHHYHRGDVLLARSGTTTVSTYAYSAFGELTSMGAADVSRFKFSSKERDPSTGFSYYGYRFYSPRWQRWISRDPIGELGFEKLNFAHSMPQSMSWEANLFVFVNNNAVTGVDPLGLQNFTTAECVAACDATFDKNAMRQICYKVCNRLKRNCCNSLYSYCMHIARHGDFGHQGGKVYMTLYLALCAGE